MSELIDNPHAHTGLPERLLRALLPWESPAAFCALHERYLRCHAPNGPDEHALVEQLVWLDWRRERLRLGERALHLASLERRTDLVQRDTLTRRALAGRVDQAGNVSSETALQTNPDDDVRDRANHSEDLRMTRDALARLDEGGDGAFDRALDALRSDTQEWWLDECEDDPDRYPETADGLRHFLETQVIPEIQRDLAGVDHRPAVRLQAWGESLDPDRLDRLITLDERLTRQYEKTLSMLLRLQEMRSE